jgi:hypothetical protein
MLGHPHENLPETLQDSRVRVTSPGPADSEEDSEVYEIEAILDAKRGASGSVSSCKHPFTKKTRLIVTL